MKTLFVWCCLGLIGVSGTGTQAQTAVIAYDAPAGTRGNQGDKGLGVGNDFYVVQPVTLWHLGVFDHQSDGLKGAATLTVQIYARNGNSGTLLETVTFDAANPGELGGGHRFKALAQPLTLLPGAYTCAAYGFDPDNKEGNSQNRTNKLAPTAWTLNDGGGLLRFEGSGRYTQAGVRLGNSGVNNFPNVVGKGFANQYAAGTFTFTAAAAPEPPYAADYAALTAGVSCFATPTNTTLGSLAVFGGGAFPLVLEPGGRRMVFAAAGRYADQAGGSRCVVFGHDQWCLASNDVQAVMFENAVGWAGRKSGPADTVVGVGPRVNPAWLVAQGYQVKLLAADLATPETDLSGCDVAALNWHAGFTPEAVAQLAQFTASGGGLVVGVTPWAISYPVPEPGFLDLNSLLRPFGLACRNSQEPPVTQGYTNLLAVAPPVYFSAFPAANLLRRERRGELRLTGYERMVALNTIHYTVASCPDLLADLTVAYSGLSGRTPTAMAAGAGNFVDVQVLPAAAASTNWLGDWRVDGDDLLATGRRGGVEYPLNAPLADRYRIAVEAGRDDPLAASQDFELIVSLDGERLGRYRLTAGNGTNATVHCFTPYVEAGPHTLTVFWDNAANGQFLRLNRVSLQTSLGLDTDADGIKDWVAGVIESESGLDNTNAVLGSHVSPVCLEGRDPHQVLMSLKVGMPRTGVEEIVPKAGIGGRWYADVPLPDNPEMAATLTVQYQNNAKEEVRHISWLPVNILAGGSFTLRKGDALLLTAVPAGAQDGQIEITDGTNRPAVRPLQHPVPQAFWRTGTHTVTGSFRATPDGPVVQTGSITVNVVGYNLPANPVCVAGKVRTWDLTNVPPEVVLECDPRLLMEQTATLGDGGLRLGLMADTDEARTVLARLGQGGPVLSQAQALGIPVYSGVQTYNHTVEVYADGSRLVETLIVAPKLYPGVRIKLTIFVGGVTFDDGTIVKWLTAEDFNALGECKVLFLKAPGVTTSNCHKLEIYQGDELIGSR